MSGGSSTVYRRLYEAWNYRLRTLAGGRWARFCRPTSIYILVTEHCTAKCLHCDIWKNSGIEDSPSVEQWKTLLSDLRSWLGPVHVGITGGEALMKPFTIDLVDHARRIGLCLEILTNGYWEDQDKIRRLAEARPWRITISLDGIGDTHTLVRGRPKFWERTSRTVETLNTLRKEQDLGYTIRLKTVIMQQNLDAVEGVVDYARQQGVEIFLQPIEQNYNTEEDVHWYEASPNWPRDPGQAVRVVERVRQMKRLGFPVVNSDAQLAVMIPYFRQPEASRVLVQSHQAHESVHLCSALTGLQVQANGDVRMCASMSPAGNIRERSIRDIWESRPRYWENRGCCVYRRFPALEAEPGMALKG